MSIKNGRVLTRGIGLALALAAFAACNDQGTIGSDPETGQISASISASDDVASVAFKVVMGTDTCAGAAVASATVPVAGGFSDKLFVLAPNSYRVCAVPLKADGTPSASCGAVDSLVTVMAGVTAEITLTSQCGGGPDNGGVDTSVNFNTAPVIRAIDIRP